MSYSPPRPLWSGRFRDPPDALALELSGSRDADLPLAAYDVDGSVAHVDELLRLGVVDAAAHSALTSALNEVGRELAAGSFRWQPEHEDIHMNVEAAVRDLVGPELAGQLQAGRSRNEEIVSDERRWLLDTCRSLDRRLTDLQRALVRRAGEELDTILPAFTHTQPAQPVVLAHHLLAYVEMLERDRGRIAGAAARADRSPAGSGAAVGSFLALDRDSVARRLGFSAPTANSLDAVADRDYATEVVAACAIGLGHLSRLAGELVLWSTPFFGFAQLPDAFASGSSMLPNKRNPDAAELVRARAARAAGELVTLLTLPRGLPLAYHRDFQETRVPMLDAARSYDLCLRVSEQMVAGVSFDRGAMRRAASGGHGLAMALAERLVAAGVPFREAHARVGELVLRAEEDGVDLRELPEVALRDALPELRGHDRIMPTLEEAVAGADVPGGTAPERVRSALREAAERLGLGQEALGA